MSLCLSVGALNSFILKVIINMYDPIIIFFNEDHGIWSHHFMGNRWRNSENSVRLYFSGLQNQTKSRTQLSDWTELTIFCRSFPSLAFSARTITLALVAKLVWWSWILLTFGCLESCWFLHEIWMRVLLGRVFLVVLSSLSSL